MKLNEAKRILKKAGYLLEDTDARRGEGYDGDELITALHDGYYFEKPDAYDVRSNAIVCRNTAAKKEFQKEFLALFDSSNTPRDFLLKCAGMHTKYFRMHYKLDDKIYDMENYTDEEVPEEMKEQLKLYEMLSDAYDDWQSGRWPGYLVLKCTPDMKLARQLILYLFENNFTVKSATEVYNRLLKIYPPVDRF